MNSWVWSGVCLKTGVRGIRERSRPYALTCLTLAGLLALGCERTISERERTTTHRDGTVTKTSETVKEAPDGSIKVEREREVNR